MDRKVFQHYSLDTPFHRDYTSCCLRLHALRNTSSVSSSSRESCVKRVMDLFFLLCFPILIPRLRDSKYEIDLDCFRFVGVVTANGVGFAFSDPSHVLDDQDYDISNRAERKIDCRAVYLAHKENCCTQEVHCLCLISHASLQ